MATIQQVVQKKPVKNRRNKKPVIPMFVRHGSQDRFELTALSDSMGDSLLTLLKKCELAARPIKFETIDVILRNKDAENLILTLTGRNSIDEVYRLTQLQNLEEYLRTLEKLAQHWKLLKQEKYEHRKKSYGIYNNCITMVPYRQPNSPFFSSKTLLSSGMKPYVVTSNKKKITMAGHEY